MRFPAALLALGLLASLPDGARGFDPSSDALVLVNLTVPAPTAARTRLDLSAASVRSADRTFPAEPAFDRLDSDELFGRAPRWLRLVVNPGFLDSLVLDWSSFEVEVDGAWTSPRVRTSTVVALHRNVERGSALVVNLAWRPDTTDADAPDWHPVFEVEDHVEPPQGGRIYVSEEDEGIVSVFERVGGRMVRALALGGRPRDLAFDRLQQRLYVALGARDELVVVDVAGRETVRRLPLSFGADPTRVLLTRDGERVAVIASGRDQVFLYSTSSLQEIASVPVGQGPVAIVEETGGGRLFVTCRTSGEIQVIDPGTGRALGRFGGFESPSELVALGSGLLAVGESRTSRIQIVDPNSGAAQPSMRICGSTSGLFELPRYDRLYAVDQGCSEIAIFQSTTGVEVGSIPLDEPAGLPTPGPRGVEFFLPLPGSRRVVLLSADRGELQLLLETGSGPWRALAP